MSKPQEFRPTQLKGKSLIDAKKKHHIGPLKDKLQLIKALEKAADEELTEKAKAGTGRGRQEGGVTEGRI